MYSKLTFTFTIALVLALTACGKQIDFSVPQDTAPAANSDTPVTSNARVSANTQNPVIPVDTSVTVTVFSKTKTIAPMAGWPTKTYTATGSCLVYTGNTYCWDDGKKTVVISGFNYYYSYFNMSKNAVGYSHSNGGMQTDLMTAPTIIAAGSGLATNMAVGAVSEVLSTGSALDVVCSVDVSGSLNCGSFIVDINQVPL